MNQMLLMVQESVNLLNLCAHGVVGLRVILDDNESAYSFFNVANRDTCIVRRLYENGKNQGILFMWKECWGNFFQCRFNLLLQGSFYHPLCLVYFIAKHQ